MTIKAYQLVVATKSQIPRRVLSGVREGSEKTSKQPI